MEIIIILVLFAIVLTVVMLISNYNYKKILNVDEKSQEKILNQVRKLQDAYNLTPEQFENLVARLFEKMGYFVETTSTTRDGGIDLYLSKNNQNSIVQCKRYKGNVSVGSVREFYGVMIHNNLAKGYFVTTGNFTLPAHKFAEDKGIHLIDGTELGELLTENLE